MQTMAWIRRSGWCLAVCALSVVCLAGPLRGDANTAGESRLLDGVKFLASDELEGRGIGTEGLNRAAEYIRSEFEKAGVGNGAFQKFTMVTGTKLGKTNALSFVGPHGREIKFKYDADFRTCGFSGSKTFDGELIFGGYAIDAADEKYQDFEGVDLKGKVVIIMRRVPQQKNPHSPFAGAHGSISRHGGLLRKVRNAAEKGAAAILFVNDPYTTAKNAETDRKIVDKANKRMATAAEELLAVDAGESDKLNKARKKLKSALSEWKAARTEAQLDDNDPLMKLKYLARGKSQSMPIAHITQKACNRLLSQSLKTSLADIEAAIDNDLKPRTQVLTGWKARGETSVDKIRTEVKNVVGILEGEGPLDDETIVIGAHYDHLGRGGSNSLLPGSTDIHNGADDNASGISSLIELVRRLAARKQKLPRRLVFIAFTAEETGLIGSAHYVKQPLFPLAKTIAMFNMDMVGRLRDDKLTIFGSGTAPRWKELLETVGKKRRFKLTLKPDGFGPSDQSSFYSKKIPVLHLFTGNHSDYHRPSDDWQKINATGMLRVVDLLEEIVVATATTPARPKYLAVERKKSARRGGSRPYFGSIPDFSGEGDGYALSGVSPGSPAAKGGLKAGDRIIKLGKHKIADLNDFDLALRDLSPGDEINVVVLRKGKKIPLKVTLAKPR